MTTDAQPALQSTDLIMMVRPASFRMNEQTAVNNAYQQSGDGVVNVMEIAQEEFDGVVAALEGQGVRVAAYDDDPDADTPDALFPNNWVSFHRDGRVGLYPMFAPNRRKERRESLLHMLAEDHNLDMREWVDFTEFESHDVFLEGTGSLILDRIKLDLPGDVYFVKTLPVIVHGTDLLTIGGVAILICFLATIYPSWEASKMPPIQAIRGD